MATTIDNYQASLAITQFLAPQGIFPSRDEDTDSGPGTGFMPMAMIRAFGGNFVPGGNRATDGHLLPISQNTALFSLIGTYYGGDGRSTFAVPNLGGVTMIGSTPTVVVDDQEVGFLSGTASILLSQQNMPAIFDGSRRPIENAEPSLTITYAIRTTGSDPTSTGFGFLGEVARFAGNFVPTGFMKCDGRLLTVADNQELFAIIGYSYGGSGTHFRLPDLIGRNAVGATIEDPVGTLVGTDSIVLTNAHLPSEMGGSGQPLDNQAPGVAMRYIISLQGVFPPRDGGGGAPYDQPYVGEISLFAGNVAPRGWAFCEGQLLSISQNTALFSLLGTMYGGNGQTNFALPDFRGRTAIGTDVSLEPGDVVGSNTNILDLADIPNLTVTGSAAAETLYGGGNNDTLTGLGGNDTLIGNPGDDRLRGGDGNDILIGGLGADTLEGGAGNDTYVLENGTDVVVDTGGTDRITSTITRSLANYASIEGLTLAGANAINGIGNALNNTLTGNAAANTLSGAAGDDRLTGNAGNDVLIGGVGRDTMTGGADEDVFVFSAGLNATTNIDTITDFTPADDTIRLDNLVFKKLANAGPLAGIFFKVGPKATDANDYIVYYRAEGALFYDADGSGAGAAIQFATLTNKPLLTAADFVVI